MAYEQSLNLGIGHYLVSVDLLKLKTHPRFKELTDSSQNDRIHKTARFIGRGDPPKAYLLVHVVELGDLLVDLLEGLEQTALLNVQSVNESTVPHHLRENALRYFGRA